MAALKNPGNGNGDGDGSEELKPASLLHILVTASEVYKYSIIYVLIFSMTFWAVVFGFFMLAIVRGPFSVVRPHVIHWISDLARPGFCFESCIWNST